MHPRQEAKFGAYLLACKGLQTIHGRLCQMAREGTNSHLDIVQAFETRLLEFFRSNTHSSHVDSAIQLTGTLPQVGTVARALNDEAGNLWDSNFSALTEEIPSWDFRQHIAEVHESARKLACGFFGKNKALAHRLHIVCECQMDCQESSRSAPAMSFTHATGLIETLFSFHPEEQYFQWYVALPFRFLHEYTAHVFACDPRYQIFTDGWMLWAASRFVEKRWIQEGTDFEWSEEQVYVFRDAIQWSLGAIPNRGLRVAHIFEDFLTEEDRGQLFFEVTDALCGLDKIEPRERLRLIDAFIKALEKLLPSPVGKSRIRGVIDLDGPEFIEAVNLLEI